MKSEKRCCQDMEPEEKAYILLSGIGDPSEVLCPACIEEAERLSDQWADGVLG